MTRPIFLQKKIDNDKMEKFVIFSFCVDHFLACSCFLKIHVDVNVLHLIHRLKGEFPTPKYHANKTNFEERGKFLFSSS